MSEQYYVHYAEPGETGNKVDVRWLTLSGDGPVGLLAAGLPHLSVSALPFTTADLDGPKHSYELTPREFTTLALDLKQMGVGGDDSCGAQPHEEYRLPPTKYGYQFCLRTSDPAHDSPAALVKQALPWQNR